MRYRLVLWRVAGPSLPHQLDRHRRHCGRRRRRLSADRHHRRALPQEQPMKSFDTYSDDDFKRSIWSALRMIAIAVALSVPLLWWKLGWQSAVLLAVGA